MTARNRHTRHWMLALAAVVGAVVATGCTSGSGTDGPTTMPSPAGTAPTHAPSGSPDLYYAPNPWSGHSGGTQHVSTFVYRDVNRTGTFDVGERPLAHIAIVMTRPDGSTATARSNVDGFANFDASATDEDADITTAGDYTFEAMIPPRWDNTSGNPRRVQTFRLAPGAPGDIAFDGFAPQIGMAPQLSISGTAPAATSTPNRADLRATVVGPTGHVDAPVDAAGRFTCPAAPGDWTVRLPDPLTGATVVRPVVVGAVPVQVSAAGGQQPRAASSTVTIGFDDLIRTDAVAEVAHGYSGLDWHNVVVTHNRMYLGEGYLNGTTSGDYVIYGGSGHPAAVSRVAPFDFIGGYLSVAWASAEGETATLRAWNGSSLLYEDRVTLSALGPVYFAADYTGITRLELSTEHYWQLVADDLTFGV